MIFCISTSMPAEYWYVPRVPYTTYSGICYVQKFHPTHSLFILTWGGVLCRVLVQCVVEYPCLASPGPSRTILSQSGVLACVLGSCLQGFVSNASIELFPASLPELL